MSQSSPELDYDPDAVTTVTTETGNALEGTDKPESTIGDPAFDGPIEEGHTDANEDTKKARDSQKDIDKSTGDIEDEEKDSAKSLEDIATELTSGGGQNSSPMLSQPQQAQTAMPQMPQPQMPQPQMPQIPQGAVQVPKEALAKLLGSYTGGSGGGNGVSDTSGSGGRVGAVAGKEVNKDQLGPGEVSFDKYPGGPLTPGQMDAVLEDAMDAVGIPDNEKVREEWKELYLFMAQHESSNTPNACSDSNPDNPDPNNRDYPASSPWSKINASDGYAQMSSRGVWQCIPSTFGQWHVAGTSNSIYDPVASAAASMNYVMNDPKYGVSPNGGSSLAAFFADRRQNGYKGY